MDNQEITGMLNGKFGNAVLKTDESGAVPVYTVDSRAVHEILEFLKEDPGAGFSYLTTLCGIHYPDSELPFGVIYHLHNLPVNKRIRIKTFLAGPVPEVETVTDLWSGANWMERETYDFYGIVFRGHPNLKRILNVEYLDFFPMRKEYPLEDPTREDKEDRLFGR